ncbi:MAG: glycosyl transferase [Bacteroidetes bacterium HGW-Bacteroidetes-4]|jgi:ADP-heptose:LPS heptosyltransferase|nr:MAG: glycosyl transferase [Bacteroidetes bacterium HGW-Bacteroidetes-4]
MVKFLIVRFSSIGDIVLTTPVIRGLKQQVENAEVHFLTKPQFARVLAENPYIDKLLLLKETINDTVDEINNEGYDYLIDLHHNLRTSVIKRKTGLISFSFDKLNFKKWLLVNLKINRMPDVHIVDRYRDTVRLFDVNDDGKGLDYFIPESEEVVPEQMHAAFAKRYLVAVVGANYFTKQIPAEKLIEIINRSGIPACLVGGNDVLEQAAQIEKGLKVPFLNTVGKISLHQSASFIRQAAGVITPDTGMMHIAAAFKKPVVSLWGNTVPELGMYPYRADERSKIFEVPGLSCRPCSKIGYNKCPKGHFKCMQNIDTQEVVKQIQLIINN